MTRPSRGERESIAFRRKNERFDRPMRFNLNFTDIVVVSRTFQTANQNLASKRQNRCRIGEYNRQENPDKSPATYCQKRHYVRETTLRRRRSARRSGHKATIC